MRPPLLHYRSYIPLLLLFLIHLTSSLPTPLQNNDPSTVQSPQTLIPSTFFTHFQPRLSTTLPTRSLFTTTLKALIDFTTRDAYNAVTTACQVGGGGGGGVAGTLTITAQPLPNKGSLFQTRYVLWGLYRCLKTIVAAGEPEEGATSKGGTCVLAIPRGKGVGRVEFQDGHGGGGGDATSQRGNETTTASELQEGVALDTASTLAGAGTNPAPGAFLVSRAPPERNAQIDYTSFLPPSANGITSTLSASPPSADTCSQSYPHTNSPTARIGDLGAPLGSSRIIFMLMEAVLEFAAKVPRPEVLDSEKIYEYTSEVEGVYGSLQVRRPPFGEEIEVTFEQVVKGFGAVAAAMETHGRWEECDFVVFRDEHSRKPIIDGRLRKAL